MPRFKVRTPSSALVIAVLALFVGLGGGAYAATKIGTNDIKNKAVVSSKIDKQAVTSTKLDKQAVKSSKIRKQAVKSGKVAIGAITSSKLLNPTFWAYVVGSPPSISRSNGALSAARTAAGNYQVAFDPEEIAEVAARDLTDCSYQVTPSITGPGREAQVDVDPANVNGVSVRIRNSTGGPVDSNYSVAVFC